MSHFYSDAKKGFFAPEFHSDFFIEDIDTNEDGITVDRRLIVDPEGPIADAVELTAEEYIFLKEQLSLGKIISVDHQAKVVNAVDRSGPTFDHQVEYFTQLIQERLDQFAVTKNYDNCLSCCTYATSAVQKFANEAQYLIERRDQHWAAGYQILEQVKNNERPIPTKSQLFEELGPLEWPE